MITPTIHLNGSHGPTLRDEYIKAMYAVHDAQVLLQQIDINPRDYYVQRQVDGSPSTFTQANMERLTMWRNLEVVRAQLEEIAQSIENQVNDRMAARS